jgi:3'-phosphoadenosine 5'-phosphosulfate sulfotransferase (PAPS reductase)/FAD synthetase
MVFHHIVNISGGKDSATCALLAAERGRPFRLVMADTGNESPITMDYAHQVADFVGHPLEMVRADFTDRIAAKRRYVETKWPIKGVPDHIVQAALDVLHPTGNPFLDLCIWKGRFPSRMAQFCTEELKANAIGAYLAPLYLTGPVVHWIGVRRDESLNRRNAPMFHRVRRNDDHDLLLFRPIIHWTAQNVFSYAAARGLPPNPLYLQGMGRVGCFPCINAAKPELGEIGRRYPEVIERLLLWERIVAAASKRQRATFFTPDVTPEGSALGAKVKAVRDAGGDADALSAVSDWPDAARVFDWAKTTRGGRQYDLMQWGQSDDGLSCSSQYGLCE